MLLSKATFCTLHSSYKINNFMHSLEIRAMTLVLLAQFSSVWGFKIIICANWYHISPIFTLYSVSNGNSMFFQYFKSNQINVTNFNIIF